MVVQKTDIESALLQFLRQNLLEDDVQIGADDVLRDFGIDSYATVEILLFIERKYDYVIPDDHLLPENLKSVASIAKTIVDHIQPK